MRIIWLICFFAISGCVHQLDVSPRVEHFFFDDAEHPVKKNVAYVMSDADRNEVFRSQHRGGDIIEFTAYSDIEAGLRAVLESVFSEVTNIAAEDQINSSLDYIFNVSLSISTSGGTGTWPPELATVTLDCYSTDSQHKRIWQTTIDTSHGATTKDWFYDHPYAIREALIDALRKLRKAIAEEPIFHE